MLGMHLFDVLSFHDIIYLFWYIVKAKTFFFLFQFSLSWQTSMRADLCTFVAFIPSPLTSTHPHPTHFPSTFCFENGILHIAQTSFIKLKHENSFDHVNDILPQVQKQLVMCVAKPRVVLCNYYVQVQIARSLFESGLFSCKKLRVFSNQYTRSC